MVELARIGDLDGYGSPLRLMRGFLLERRTPQLGSELSPLNTGSSVEDRIFYAQQAYLSWVTIFLRATSQSKLNSEFSPLVKNSSAEDGVFSSRHSILS